MARFLLRSILAPLEHLEAIGIKISRERGKSVINSIIADCLLKMLSERPDERQYYLVSDILDLVGETVQGELETAISLMTDIQGKEGYALTTLYESHNMKTNQDTRDNSWKTLRAAEICEKLGTGGQVIFQSEEVSTLTPHDRSSLRKAMKGVKRSVQARL